MNPETPPPLTSSLQAAGKLSVVAVRGRDAAPIDTAVQHTNTQGPARRVRFHSWRRAPCGVYTSTHTNWWHMRHKHQDTHRHAGHIKQRCSNTHSNKHPQHLPRAGDPSQTAANWRQAARPQTRPAPLRCRRPVLVQHPHCAPLLLCRVCGRLTRLPPCC